MTPILTYYLKLNALMIISLRQNEELNLENIYLCMNLEIKIEDLSKNLNAHLYGTICKYFIIFIYF